MRTGWHQTCLSHRMSFLVAIDLSAPSFAAIEIAAWLGRSLGEEVWLLHVAKDTPSLERLAALYDLAAPLREAGVQARLRTASGEIVPRVIQEAVRRGCRWILTGTQGSASSVARSLMARSPLPVLAVRPGAQRSPVHSLVLRAPPRSRAPLCWEIVGLLSDAIQTPFQSVSADDPCGTCDPRLDRQAACREDVLIVVDAREDHDLAQERCTVLMVGAPVLKATEGVSPHTAT